MHIEPGVVSATKLAPSDVTAAGALGQSGPQGVPADRRGLRRCARGTPARLRSEVRASPVAKAKARAAADQGASAAAACLDGEGSES
jgi:hypothetical protein